MYFRTLRKTNGEISLSEPIETDRDGSSLALMDVISSEVDLAEQLDARDDRTRIYKSIFKTLDERERQIISMRYGILGVPAPLTQREIASICGISRSYVSRIEKKALSKLKIGFECAKA